MAKDALTLNRSRAGIPKLSITGSRNDLDYYSSDGDEDEHALGSGGVAGGLLMGVRARRIGGSIRSLTNRKAGLVIPDSALPSTTDVLGSIMNEQERWMTISNPKNINKIKIKSDGRLEFEGDNLTGGTGTAGNGGASNVPVTSAAAGSAEISTNATSGVTGNSAASGNEPATTSSNNGSAANGVANEQ